MADRHRPGYYAEYAKRTGKKDRHKKGYYREYNKNHPERLNRGYTKGCVNGCLSDGIETGGYYVDSIGHVRSKDFFNPTLTDLIEEKLSSWHDDDWCEERDL